MESAINSKFKEYEYKYFAEEIKLSDFIVLMENLKKKYPFKRYTQASSFDTYYVKPDSKEEFQRFRFDGKRPELTKKVKMNSTNSWERIESDLPLDPKRITEEKVSFHVSLDGYKENFKIFKTCFVYKFEEMNYVWYVVYNKNLSEIGRFVEVELNKEKLNEIKNQEDSLRQYEEELSVLGITPQKRLRKNLFEMYREDM